MKTKFLAIFIIIIIIIILNLFISAFNIWILVEVRIINYCIKHTTHVYFLVENIAT